MMLSHCLRQHITNMRNKYVMRQETRDSTPRVENCHRSKRHAQSRTSVECMRTITIDKENAKNGTIKIEMLGEKKNTRNVPIIRSLPYHIMMYTIGIGEFTYLVFCKQSIHSCDVKANKDSFRAGVSAMQQNSTMRSHDDLFHHIKMVMGV